jgi:hypothetical protein
MMRPGTNASAASRSTTAGWRHTSIYEAFIVMLIDAAKSEA